MSKSIRIAILSDQNELTQLTQKLPSPWREQVLVRETAGSDALKIVKELEKDGADVIVTTQIVRTLLLDKISLPAVAIPITTYDLIHTFEEAKKRSSRSGYADQRIAVFQLKRLNPRIPKIAELMGIPIVRFLFHTLEEGRTIMVDAFNQGIRFFVGGSLACEVSKELGCECVPFEIRMDTLVETLQSALEIAESIQQERSELMELHAILNFAFEGIITCDAHGVIRMINPTASRLLNVDPEQTVVQKRLADVAGQLWDISGIGRKTESQIVTIGGNKLIFSRVPLILGDSLQGMVIHLKEVAGVQRLEHKIRREVYAKGHVAKYSFQDIVGDSPSIRRTIRYAERFAMSDETVLIEGESGTGKELFAQSIHNGSNRVNNPFVAINCASLPDNLLESELFGYVEGAFTGAKKGGRVGLFEIAHKGTLFLDEIGDISSLTQAKLLRVLQEKQIRRVGGDELIPVDVRIIAATNKDLSEMVSREQFRLDLYYRLNVLKLKIPPLRDRLQDIPALVRLLLSEHGVALEPADLPEFERVFEILQSHSWPGNIRELENIITRFCVFSHIGDRDMSLEALFQELLGAKQKSESGPLPFGSPRSHGTKTLDDLEARAIREAYEAFSGNREKIAKELGMSRTTLWRKLKKLGMA